MSYDQAREEYTCMVTPIYIYMLNKYICDEGVIEREYGTKPSSQPGFVLLG